MSDFDILYLYLSYRFLGILTSLRRLVCLFLYIKIENKTKKTFHNSIKMKEKNYLEGEIQWQQL